MDHLSPQGNVQWSNERQRRIYNRLLLVGKGAAQFYRDACRIMAAQPPYEATTHLVGHCLREIESAIRSVVVPVARSLCPTWVESYREASEEERSEKKGRKGGGGKNRALSFEEQIRLVLFAFQISDTDDTALLWLRITHQEEFQLHSYAHRNNLAEARPITEAFRQFWNEMNLVFDRILDAYEARYLETQVLIDKYLLMGLSSIDEKISFLTQNMPHDPVALTYFFEQIGNKKDAAWLKPLRENGYFRHPPQPEFDAETNMTRLRRWPASAYLVQVASVEPSMVRLILLEMEQTQNVHVYEDCVDALCCMPVELSIDLVARVKEWICVPYQGLLPEKVGAFIVHLAQDNAMDGALDLVDGMLNHFANLQTSFDQWSFTNVLKDVLVALSDISSVRVPTFLVDIFLVHISDEGFLRTVVAWHPGGNLGEAWPSEMIHELGILLLLLLQQTITALMIQRDEAIVMDIVQLLMSYDVLVFRRLVLFVLSEHVNTTLKEAAACLTDQRYFDDIDVRREYVRLLQAAFPHLSSTDQATILGWIDMGPDDTDRVKMLYERFNTQPFTDDLALLHRKQWQRDWYARFGSTLPDELQLRYKLLVKECGEADLAETYPKMIAAQFSRNASPKTVDEVIVMEESDIVSFLKTWQPPEDVVFAMLPSRAGLSDVLKQAAIKEPEQFSRMAQQFQALPHEYIDALLSGLLEVSKRAESALALSWDSVLLLCLAIVYKRQDALKNSQEGPQWKETCLIVLELVAEWCKRDVLSLPISYRQQIWAILSSSIEDPHPSFEEECLLLAQMTDRILLGDTTVRGRALYGVLSYAIWVMRFSPGDEEQNGYVVERQGFVLIPEVQEVLEKHLDLQRETSVLVHSLYGRGFGALVSMDRFWVVNHLDQIFPQNDGVKVYRRAALETYYVFWRPARELYLLLADQYRWAVDELETFQEQPITAFQPESHLAEHIMLLYLWGIIQIDEPGGLLPAFFIKASLSLRRHILAEIGRRIAIQIDHVEVIEPIILSRSQALWEWRVRQLSDSAHHPDTSELLPFRWWFNSGQFSPEWSLDQLETVLRLHGTIEAPASVIEHLATLSETMPLQAIQCLSLLAPAARNDWKTSTWSQHVRTILERALSMGEPEARTLAVERIHRFGAEGENYRDLLDSNN